MKARYKKLEFIVDNGIEIRTVKNVEDSIITITASLVNSPRKERRCFYDNKELNKILRESEEDCKLNFYWRSRIQNLIKQAR